MRRGGSSRIDLNNLGEGFTLFLHMQDSIEESDAILTHATHEQHTEEQKLVLTAEIKRWQSNNDKLLQRAEKCIESIEKQIRENCAFDELPKTLLKTLSHLNLALSIKFLILQGRLTEKNILRCIRSIAQSGEGTELLTTLIHQPLTGKMLSFVIANKSSYKDKRINQPSYVMEIAQELKNSSDHLVALETTEFSPLEIASYFGHREICQTLISEHEAKVTSTAVAFSIKNGPQLVSYLFGKYLTAGELAEPININLLLLAAVAHGVIATVKYLINLGANINFIIDSGPGLWSAPTALHLAVKYKKLDMLTFLLKSKPKIDITDSNPAYAFLGTPFYFAARRGQWESARLLMEQKADINIHPQDQLPAIYHYMTQGNIEAVLILLDAGAKIKDFKELDSSQKDYINTQKKLESTKNQREIFKLLNTLNLFNNRPELSQLISTYAVNETDLDAQASGNLMEVRPY